jgi:hypothetical protein
MKQHFYNYKDWECFQNNMYTIRNNETHINHCKLLLSNQELFYTACLLVIKKYKISCLHHLTNNSINKKAYMGAAACNLMNDSSEIEVREAWSLLNEKEKTIANIIATKVINEYINKLNNNRNEQISLKL